ncbi:MAG: universal stress protein [Chloroflexi bacterium]|nr:universal stress protein [Chloroflexota bacterium]
MGTRAGTVASVDLLIATDGSEHSHRAIRSVAALDWPNGTRARLITVIPEVIDLAGVVVEDLMQAQISEAMDGTLARARELMGPLRDRTQRAVLRGRPADAILEGADAFAADLVVLGHRGRGPVAARLLGSVAAEVAERSRRAVLIVRGDIVGPVVLADDGSAPARAARRIIATWPMFERREIRVISVATVAAPLASGIAITMREEAAAARREEVAQALAVRSLSAREAEVELRAAGRDVSVTLATGDPGHEICALARMVHAGLVVVGCRGHNVFAGLLGTTAKGTVLGAPCSVLVVHAPAASKR